MPIRLQPIAVLLCPGWEKVQTVHSLLEESNATRPLHPFMVLLGVGKDEAKAVKIPKNCESHCRLHVLMVLVESQTTCCVFFTRPGVGDHALQPGPAAVLSLLHVPARVPPGAGRGRPALRPGSRPGEQPVNQQADFVPLRLLSQVYENVNVLLSGGDHLAALPESGVQGGQALLSPADCCCSKAMDQTHGGAVSRSHVAPFHRHHCPRGSCRLR